MTENKLKILGKAEMTEEERAHHRGEIFLEINESLPFKHKDLLDLMKNSGGKDRLMDSDIEKIRERLHDIGNSLDYVFKHLQAFQGLRILNPKTILEYALSAIGFRGFPSVLPPFDYCRSGPAPHRWIEDKVTGNTKEEWERGI